MSSYFAEVALIKCFDSLFVRPTFLWRLGPLSGHDPPPPSLRLHVHTQTHHNR